MKRLRWKDLTDIISYFSESLNWNDGACLEQVREESSNVFG